jgi:hypothetical protein
MAKQVDRIPNNAMIKKPKASDPMMEPREANGFHTREKRLDSNPPPQLEKKPGLEMW